MKAYELLARLEYCVLTEGKWSDETFIGSFKNWQDVRFYESNYE